MASGTRVKGPKKVADGSRKGFEGSAGGESLLRQELQRDEEQRNKGKWRFEG